VDIAFQTTIDYGGVGRFSVEILRNLATLCDQITVYPTPISVEKPTEHPWWRHIPNNVTVEKRHGTISSLYRHSIAFRKHDLVHINYASYGFPAVLSNLTSDTPFVFTHHYGGSAKEMSDSLGYRTQYWIEQSVFLPLVLKYGSIVSVSDYNAARLSNSADVDVIYHGGSRGMFETDPLDNIQELNISGSDYLVLFTGKLHGFKDGETVIEAFKTASQRTDKKLTLVIAGGSGGYDEGRIRDKVEKKSNHEGEIVLVEDVNDQILHTLYETADVFAFPSYAESFGLVFLEAMEGKTPIIHSDEGAAPEVVGDAGIEISARDSRECANAMLEIIEDADTRENLIAAAENRRRAFSWEKAARKYYEKYEQLINENQFRN